MNTTVKTFALAFVAGTCGSVAAQDSVSTLGGLPGDALDPTDTALQCVDYVVDLAPVTTSKGTVFGVAPIIKSARVNTSFNNNLISAQAISPDILSNVNISGNTYSLWEMTPGAGVNPVTNSMPGSIAGPASTSQFAAGFASFGTLDNANNGYNDIIGAVVNYDPMNPNRLYVQRRVAAVNVDSLFATSNTAQLGFGSIDANGNAYFRADDFGVGAVGGLTAVSGNNLFRVDMLDRTCNALNVISGNGLDAASTTQFLAGSPDAHLTPSNIPESVFMSGGSIAATNFNTEFLSGSASLSSSTAHIPGGFGGDTRGAFGYSTFDALGNGGVSSFAVIGKDNTNENRVLYVWEVNASGAPTVTFGADSTAVGSYTDPTDGTVIDPSAIATFTGGDLGEFNHVGSQTAFRGGTGQVALGRDQAGRTIAAATWDDDINLGNDYWNQSILAARWTPGSAGATIEWSVVAYIDQLSTSSTGSAGKPILDANGDAVGRIIELFNVTGGSPLGPSMSSPAIDSVGNVWFVASVGLFTNPVPIADAQTEVPSDPDSALIRAVYNPATFGYELELVAELGTVFDGPNSGLPYQLTFTGVADNNSVSSGTVFSGNASGAAWNNTSTAGLDTADAITNGGFVLNANVAYDSNPGDADNDGFVFNDAGDEEYSVLLYFGYYEENQAPVCRCDVEGDGDLDPDDINAFVMNFTDGTPGNADIDGDGDEDPDDISAFVTCFTASPAEPGCDF